MSSIAYPLDKLKDTQDLPALERLRDLLDQLFVAATHVYRYRWDEPKACFLLSQVVIIGYEHATTLMLGGDIPGFANFLERLRTMTGELAQLAE